MNFLPLILGAGVISGTEKAASSAPDKSKSEKIINRDSNACRFCGFVSEKFQRVVANPDSKHNDTYITVCTFCEQVIYPDRGATFGAGVLAWIPELSQVDINHLVRAIYIAREGEGAIAEAALKALDTIMARRADAKKRLGTDDPLVVAAVFSESLTKAESGKALVKMDGVRFIPTDKYTVKTPSGSINQFPKMMAYWMQAKNSTLADPTRWGDLFQQLKATA